MLQGWAVVGIARAYIAVLFAVASYATPTRPEAGKGGSRPLIYPLSLAVYCTSWTFFGSVGLASKQGFDFLTIYIGPVLMIGLGYPLILKIVRLAKAQNITSIADFIAARYGKSQAVAVMVTIVAVIGAIPYIALQLKAVSASLITVLGHDHIALAEFASEVPVVGDIAFLVAVTMAVFAVLFGTRQIDATEHQEGLMLAIATESVIKLVAFLVVGIYIPFFLFGGPSDLWAKAASLGGVLPIFTTGFDPANWITMTVLSSLCFLLLPRQFHVAVVENNGENELRRASWMFPLYLFLINLFVVPIAVAGLYLFPQGAVDSDMFVLALPLSAKADSLALLAFIGGLSAATAMVIVESVAVAIMVSNDIIVPLALRLRGSGPGARADMGAMLLTARRFCIFAILLLAYLYFHLAGEGQLAQIGLLSFAAVAQFGPAFFGGLFWRRANAHGAIAGLAIGAAVWAYTLLLPSFVASGLLDRTILDFGLFGIEALKPQALFGFDAAPLTHGVFWSLGLNILAFITVSLLTSATPIERLQASIFVRSDGTSMSIAPAFRLWQSSVTAEELISTVARYLGEERTRRSFDNFAQSRGVPLDPKREADAHMLRFAEHLLASAIGAASSRLVLSLLLRKQNVSNKAALKLLDEASAAIQYNREILQTALEHVRQGIAVFDKDLQLICWNRHFGEMLDLPLDLVRVGVGLDEILRRSAERGDFGHGVAGEIVSDRLERYVTRTGTFQERLGGVTGVRAASCVERERGGEEARLAANVDASLEAVEEILITLLDISRLDTGALQPDLSNFRIDEILSQLEVEFAPLAAEKGLTLSFLPCSLAVRSDRRLLRRLLQNLVSNAIKYTPRGRGKLRVDVIDTGLGSPAGKQKVIFKEFQRLDQGARAARGLGLGLSIVERIARELEHKIRLRSASGKGATFSVEIPTVSAPTRTNAAPRT